MALRQYASVIRSLLGGERKPLRLTMVIRRSVGIARILEAGDLRDGSSVRA